MMGRPQAREPKLFYAGESLDLEARCRRTTRSGGAGGGGLLVRAAAGGAPVRYKGNESVDPEVALN